MNSPPKSGPPRVAVLLATRNGRDWLPDQIDSIFAQVGVTVRLIVGDDASTDATWQWLETTLGSRPDVTLIRYERPSGSAGANFRKLFVEAQVADADYVALADQDDVWAPEKLQRAIDRLVISGAAAYSGTVDAFWPDGRRREMTQNPNVRAADFLFEGAGQGCTFVLEGPLFADVRAFCLAHPAEAEALHYHDWLIYLLTRAWRRSWTFDSRPLIHYRQHRSNEIGARHGLAAFKRRVELIRSGWFRCQVVAASRIYLLAGGTDPIAFAIARQFAEGAKPTANWARRVMLATEVVVAGRRRLLDRLILAFAATAGWL
jgi:rhamnosyltransferase